MASFLDLLPNDPRAQFGISEMLRQEHLSSATRTAFTWSRHPGTVCLAVNKKYFAEAATNPNVVAIVCMRNAVTDAGGDKALIVADKADELFYAIHNLALHVHTGGGGLLVHGHIDPSARIADNANIGPEVSIGANTVVGDGALITGPVHVGRDCTIHPRATIGTDGLFSKGIAGKKVHVRHFGGVMIGDGSVVHTAANIARSANHLEYTHVGNEVHVGIHVNIGHDCVIGDRTEISGMSLIAGRTEIGEGCWIGASAVISNALHIGKRCKIRLGSVVIDDLPDDADVSGNFAVSHTARLKQHLAGKQKQ